MRTAKDLPRAELIEIVDALQQALYLDADETPAVWNPDKEWDGAEICDRLAAVLARRDLVPQAVTPHSP